MGSWLGGNGWQGISQKGGEGEFMKIEEGGLGRRNARQYSGNDKSLEVQANKLIAENFTHQT